MVSQFAGVRADAVVELLDARKDGAAVAAPGSTDRKLALIVEGGGMRGVLSAGSLLAVDLLGYRNCFDEVYATSAGAVNAAFFLSGQGSSGITVYFDCINNRRFYNPYRITKIVDVEYVYDYIVPQVKKLDDGAIRRNPTDLFFSMTDVATGENALLNVKEYEETISWMLKATSALPILYNRTVTVGGRKFVDGGLTCTIPIYQAIERGCTDILIILTRTSGYQVTPPTRMNKAILYLLLGFKYPKLMDAYDRLTDNTNRNRSAAVGNIAVDGVNVATICPDEAELIVGRTTIERELLIKGAHVLAQKTYRLFDRDPDVLEEIFDEYHSSTGC